MRNLKTVRIGPLDLPNNNPRGGRSYHGDERRSGMRGRGVREECGAPNQRECTQESAHCKTAVITMSL